MPIDEGHPRHLTDLQTRLISELLSFGTVKATLLLTSWIKASTLIPCWLSFMLKHKITNTCTNCRPFTVTVTHILQIYVCKKDFESKMKPKWTHSSHRVRTGSFANTLLLTEWATYSLLTTVRNVRNLSLNTYAYMTHLACDCHTQPTIYHSNKHQDVMHSCVCVCVLTLMCFSTLLLTRCFSSWLYPGMDSRLWM